MTRGIVPVTFLVIGFATSGVTLFIFHLFQGVGALLDGLLGADGTLQAELHELLNERA